MKRMASRQTRRLPGRWASGVEPGVPVAGDHPGAAAGMRLARLAWLGLPVIVVVLLLVWGMPGREVAWAELRPGDPSAWREPWRLLLGHFVHLGWVHFAMNAAALALWFLLWDEAPGERLLALAVIGFATGAALVLVSERSLVVGLSGLLHGLYAASAILAWQAPGHRLTSVLVLAGLAVKLAAEQLFGASPGTEGLIGMPVATEAHLCGAFAGGVFGLSRPGMRRWLAG